MSLSASAAARPSPDPAGRPPSGSGRIARTARSARFYLPAVAVFVIAVVSWEILFTALNFQSFLLPKPSAIVAALQANWSGGRFPLLPSALATLQEALLGLGIGTAAGLVVAFSSARWVAARGIVLPLAVAANAVPIIAFAPIFNVWFDPLSLQSKMAIAGVLCFFPVMANVTRGLVQVEAGAMELMRSYAASEWTILRKVRIPNALPYFFTALKIATTLSLIGAIVGEYFGGANSVLGRLIVNSASALKFDVTWAAILFGAVTGIVFYLAIVAIERLVVPWAAAIRVDS